MNWASLKAELFDNLRVIGLIAGLACGGVGAVMLAVQVNADTRWPPAEAAITSIGVTCDMQGAELRLSRNAYRPDYHQVLCTEVEARRRERPDITFTVKEVARIGVRFTTQSGAVIDTFGRFNPEYWSTPRIGGQVFVRYNPVSPQDISWRGQALLMYLTAGVFMVIFLVAVAVWRGGRPPGAPAAPPPAAGVPKTGPPRNGATGFGRRPAG